MRRRWAMRRRACGAAHPAVTLALPLVLALASGCGPIEYLATVPLDASGAIAKAKHLDADKYAPYEITAAQEYLHKAKVLAGYSRFQSAIKFGDKAGKNARKAQQLSVEKAALPEEAPALSPSPGADAQNPQATPVHTVEGGSKVLVVPAAGGSR